MAALSFNPKPRSNAAMKTIPLSKKCGWNVPVAAALLPVYAAILLILGVQTVSATTFYWNGLNDVKDLASWGTSTNGTGTAPTSFGANNSYRIEKPGADITGWAVTSTGNPSVQAGGTATASGSYSGVNNLTFAPTSQFSFTGSIGSFRDTLTYGNVSFGSSTADGSPGAVNALGNVQILSNEINVSTESSNRIWSIGKDVVIDSGATLDLANGTAASIVNVSGTVINNGSINKSHSGSATINFVGTGDGSVKWGGNANAFNVSIASGRSMTFTDSLNNSGGSLTVDGSLAGSSLIASATTINGTHSVGGTGIGTQTFSSSLAYGSGSIFAWELNSNLDGDTSDDATGTRGSNYDGLAASTLAVDSGAIFRVILTDTANLADSFWNDSQKWTDIFTASGLPTSMGSLFSNFQVFSGDTDITFSPAYTSKGSFGFDGSILTWTAVPEPSSALAGFLIAAGLFRRRR